MLQVASVVVNDATCPAVPCPGYAAAPEIKPGRRRSGIVTSSSAIPGPDRSWLQTAGETGRRRRRAQHTGADTPTNAAAGEDRAWRCQGRALQGAASPHQWNVQDIQRKRELRKESPDAVDPLVSSRTCPRDLHARQKQHEDHAE